MLNQKLSLPESQIRTPREFGLSQDLVNDFVRKYRQIAVLVPTSFNQPVSNNMLAKRRLPLYANLGFGTNNVVSREPQDYYMGHDRFKQTTSQNSKVSSVGHVEQSIGLF